MQISRRINLNIITSIYFIKQPLTNVHEYKNVHLISPFNHAKYRRNNIRDSFEEKRDKVSFIQTSSPMVRRKSNLWPLGMRYFCFKNKDSFMHDKIN